jgi:hypothetical protein
VHFCENDALLPSLGPQTKDLGPGHHWIISAALLPEFLEHVYEVTALKRARPSRPKAT